MSLKEKMMRAETSSWLSDGLSEAEISTAKMLGSISAQIEEKRLSMRMNQTEFARFLGVSQGMVSKYESGTYNFSISCLNMLSHKLGMQLDVALLEPVPEENFTKVEIIPFRLRSNQKISLSDLFDASGKEGIA